MSCSADYYFVFGLVAPTIILCGMFRCTELSKDSTGVIAKKDLYFLLRYTQTLSVYSVVHKVLYAICGWHTLPYLSSEQITHKKCAKLFLCKHLQHRLVGATNIGSADYSALTMRYSRNSRR